MPAAWSQLKEDEQETDARFVCTPEFSKQMSVLAEASAIVSLDSPQLEAPVFAGGPFRLSGVRILRVLKRPQLEPLNNFVEVDSPEMLMTADARKKIQNGQQYIFLLQTHLYGAGEETALYPCGILTLNAANLAMAQEAAEAKTN